MTCPMERMFEKIQAMPSIPKALEAVISSLDKANATLDDIVEPLALDPVLSSKVLRMANAAHFGLPRQVSNIDDAVRLVGFDAIRCMVLASGLMGTFEDIAGLNLKSFWRKTLIASQISKELAKVLDKNPADAYTATLMHGIGILAIHQVFPDSAISIASDCENGSPSLRVRIERKQLGFTHCQIGRTMTRHWKIPDHIGEAILSYAFPTHATSSPIAPIVNISVILASELESNAARENWCSLISNDVLEKTGLEKSDPMLQAEHWSDVVESVHALVS